MKKPKLKIIIQSILGLAIVILAWMLFQSIMQPIRFNRERDVRLTAAKERLTDIRKAQVAYKDVFGKYTGSFDTLIAFIKNDSFSIQNKTGSFNQDEMTEGEAVKKGLIKISTVKMSVNDSLFKSKTDVDEMRYIPYNDKQEFKMEAGEIYTPSKVRVKVFEASVPFETLLHGLNEQLIVNYIEERGKITPFPGLKIGSLTEATNNTGNWEK